MIFVNASLSIDLLHNVDRQTLEDFFIMRYDR